jgi:PadR family transcriptional regulator PadR
MKQLQRELKRGTLEMLLLKLLADEPTWGYELVRRLDTHSGGTFRIKEGTLYPVLYRLEDEGLIEPEWRQPERGVARKYYRLKKTGQQRLKELIEAWSGFKAAVDAVVETKTSKEES